VLLLDQRLENFADHAEMTAVTLELKLEVDEIGGGGVERSASKRPRKNAISGCDLRKLSASSNTKAPTGVAE
jgi:hypothetical protein